MVSTIPAMVCSMPASPLCGETGKTSIPRYGTCRYMQGLYLMACTVPNLHSSFLSPKTPMFPDFVLETSELYFWAPKYLKSAKNLTNSAQKRSFQPHKLISRMIPVRRPQKEDTCYMYIQYTIEFRPFIWNNPCPLKIEQVFSFWGLLTGFILPISWWG